MPILENLFASHAKKNAMKRHTGGVNKNRSARYKDPQKYMGGKGSKKRRTLVKNGVKTRNEYIDRRANTSDVPVYKRTYTQRRDNPKSTNWRTITTPHYTIISEGVFLKEVSDESVSAIERAGNFVKIIKNEAETRYTKLILDGDGLTREVMEYVLVTDVDVSRA